MANYKKKDKDTLEITASYEVTRESLLRDRESLERRQVEIGIELGVIDAKLEILDGGN